MKKIILIISLMALFGSCKNDLDVELKNNPYDSDFRLTEKIIEIQEAGIKKWNVDKNGDTTTAFVFIKLKLNPNFFNNNSVLEPKYKLGFTMTFDGKQVPPVLLAGDSVTFLEYHYYLKNKNHSALLKVTRKMTDNSVIDQSEKTFRVN